MDLLGYDENDGSNKPKNLKKEEYEKIFAQDPAFQYSKSSSNSENSEYLETDFLKEAGLSVEDEKKADEILSLLEEKTDIAKDTPALPVLILLDKNTYAYGVAGSDEQYPSGLKPDNIMRTAYLTPEQKQAMKEAQLAEAQAKYQELQDALKSPTKVVDKSDENNI